MVPPRSRRSNPDPDGSTGAASTPDVGGTSTASRPPTDPGSASNPDDGTFAASGPPADPGSSEAPRRPRARPSSPASAPTTGGYSSGSEEPTAKVDPDLLAQLAEAEVTGASVAAVVAIRRQAGRKPDPTAIRSTLDAALARVSELTSSSPVDVNVMAYMASAYLAAPAPFVRALLQQPEIVGAVAAQPRTTSSGA